MNSIIRVHVCGVFVCEKQVTTFRTEKIKPSTKNCSSSKSHLTMGPKANPTLSMFKTKFYNRNSLKLGDLTVSKIGCFLVLVLILILIFLLSQFFLLFNLSCLLSKCFLLSSPCFILVNTYLNVPLVLLLYVPLIVFTCS